MHYYFTDEKDYKNHHIDFPYVQCMVLGLLMEVSNRIGIEIQNPKLTEDIATYLMEKPYHKDTNDNFGDIFATRNLKKLQNKINNYQCNPLPILKTIQNILIIINFVLQFL